MSKKKIYIGFGVVLVLLLVVGGLYFTNFRQSAFASSFTPVYCNDPSSVCCVKTSDARSVTLGHSGSTAFSSLIVFTCPVTSSDCVFTSLSSNTNLYYGSQNCQANSVLGLASYKCSDEQVAQVGTKIPRGYKVYVGNSNFGVVFNYALEGQKLVTNLGSQISSDSCAFTIGSGTKLTSSVGTDLGVSYTVPVGSGVGTLDSCVLTWNAGDRHICGNLEEQCSVDSDCVGHTYGNQECNNHVLQTYGCNKLGLPSGVQSGFLGQNSGDLYASKLGVSQPSNQYNGQTARCEIKNSVNVQCCGDADCGSSATCDKNTWTCKASSQVQCRQNSDCGVSTQCDFTTTTLKTPICSSGKCDYSTKKIECCSNVNCPDGSFCDASNKCEAKNSNVKVACPFGCCESDAGYVDKSCSSGLFCVNHQCSTTPPSKGNTLKCDDKLFGFVTGSQGIKEECGFLCMVGITKSTPVSTCVYDYTYLIIGLVLLVVILALFMFGGKKKGKGKLFDWSDNRVKFLALLIVALFGFVVFVYFFAYIFWISVLAIVGFVLYRILLR